MFCRHDLNKSQFPGVADLFYHPFPNSNIDMWYQPQMHLRICTYLENISRVDFKRHKNYQNYYKNAMHIWFHALTLSANKFIVISYKLTLWPYSHPHILCYSSNLIINSWDKCIFSNIQNIVKPQYILFCSFLSYHRLGSMCEILCFISFTYLNISLWSFVEESKH